MTLRAPLGLAGSLDVLAHTLGVDEPVRHPSSLGDTQERDRLTGGLHVVHDGKDPGPLGQAVASPRFAEHIDRAALGEG